MDLFFSYLFVYPLKCFVDVEIATIIKPSSFNFLIFTGEVYNSIGPLLWGKNILMHYYVHPMISKLLRP